jgi:preprotein translocase subunit SecA
VVDEVDSVLIDECRNPFIINVPDPGGGPAWGEAWRCAARVAEMLSPARVEDVPDSYWQGVPLEEPLRFDVAKDETRKAARLTQQGMRGAVRALVNEGRVALATGVGPPSEAGALYVAMLAPTFGGGGGGGGGPLQVRVRPAAGGTPAGITDHDGSSSGSASGNTSGNTSSSGAGGGGEDVGGVEEVVLSIPNRDGLEAALASLGLAELPVGHDAGVEAALQAAAPAVLWTGGSAAWGRFISQALRGVHMYKKHVDYLVRDEAVTIVDAATGREKHRSRWQDGLHQALEAKEGLPVRDEDYDQGRVTYQALFNMYARLSGMTGTAATEAEELGEAYGLAVVRVPPHRPARRVDRPAEVFLSPAGWRMAVEAEVQAALLARRPLLLGSASVEQTEEVAGVVRGVALPVALDSRDASLLFAALQGLPTARELAAAPALGELGAQGAARVLAAYRGCTALLREVADRESMLAGEALILRAGRESLALMAQIEVLPKEPARVVVDAMDRLLADAQLGRT